MLKTISNKETFSCNGLCTIFLRKSHVLSNRFLLLLSEYEANQTCSLSHIDYYFLDKSVCRFQLNDRYKYFVTVVLLDICWVAVTRAVQCNHRFSFHAVFSRWEDISQPYCPWHIRTVSGKFADLGILIVTTFNY